MLFGDKGRDTGFGGGGADVARSVVKLKWAKLLDGSDH